MKIFITGGAGYIGSHTSIQLLNAGHDVVIFDNLSNSHSETINRIKRIAKKECTFLQGNICDEKQLQEALTITKPDAVIHFAGLKAVGESVTYPLSYYKNNMLGTYQLIKSMQACNIYRIIFSSSATVYGKPEHLPITEKHPLSATNPYGRSKLFIEEMLRDLYISDPKWNIVILRYFNPVGAHESGLIGEDPKGIPNNLMPFIAQVAVQRRPSLNVWGNDYPTHDGTGVRDYIHVMDLANGHVKALEKINSPQCTAINLGTGMGYSVLDVVDAFEKVSGQKIPYKICDRRHGDVAACFADPSLAHQLLDWRAEHDLTSMCYDHWRWQSKHPQGYE